MGESVGELTKIFSLPLTITLVYIKNKELDASEVGAANLEKKCQFLFDRAGRRFLRIIEYKELQMER